MAHTPALTMAAKARIAMLRRGVDRAELARRTGYSLKVVTNLISGSNTTRKGRAKVEEALGVRIWSAKSNRRDPYAKAYLPPGDFRAHFLPSPEFLRRFGLSGGTQPTHSDAQTLPPQRGADGGAPADLPPDAREPAANPTTTEPSKPAYE